METVNLKHYCQRLFFNYMIGKNKIKLIKSLSEKKYRLKEQMFLIEGDKTVAETLGSAIRVKELYATGEFLHENSQLIVHAENIIPSEKDDIRKMSLQKQPQNSLALCYLPKALPLPEKLDDFSFYLDGVQDPGNLGTIIRTCDWFGMDSLYCSPDTADVFNPKVIQASMGSFCRVNLIYTEFVPLAQLAKHLNVPLIGTSTDGESLYDFQLPASGIIILGNEGRGIRDHVASKAGIHLSVPSFSPDQTRAESLNVATTAAIICSEIRRRGLLKPSTQN
jgi:RNA methyltransferase, TrmH family